MSILLKLHYAKFDVSRLFRSNVIEEKPLGARPRGKDFKELSVIISSRIIFKELYHQLFGHERNW